jgi:hypothetical protein
MFTPNSHSNAMAAGTQSIASMQQNGGLQNNDVLQSDEGMQNNAVLKNVETIDLLE